jgi:hypothetical protein
MLSQDSFREIIAKFPNDDARLRRVQVRLAVLRAFVLASTFKRVLKFDALRKNTQRALSNAFHRLGSGISERREMGDDER